MTSLAQRMFPMESAQRAVVSLIAAISGVIGTIIAIGVAIVSL